jgi:cytochrome c553
MTVCASLPGLSPQQYHEAMADFERLSTGHEAVKVVDRLSAGMNLLRDSFLHRIHGDADDALARDSMMISIAPLKSEEKARVEIELYQIHETAIEIDESRWCAAGETGAADRAALLDWLVKFRLSDWLGESMIERRLSGYAGKRSDERRLLFAAALERSYPEARRAPLIVYRLVGLAAAIHAALAFGDCSRARDLRKRQKSLLSSIADCRACHGEVLDSGEKCLQCGNPFWKYEWLVAD